MDYQDLFLYYNALAEEAAGLVPDPSGHQNPSSHPVAAPKEVCDSRESTSIVGEGQEQRWPTAARDFLE